MAEKKKSGVNKLLDMAAEDEIGSLDGMENTFGLHASPTLSLSSDESEKIVELKISEVHPNPNQPRKHFDEKKLHELAANIRVQGLISPILVRPSGKIYEIVAGERRYQASKIAGLKTIKCIVREMSDKESFKISLMENLLREDLDPFEEAAGYETLYKDYGMTQTEIGEIYQKSQAEISLTIRLNALPESIRSDYSHANISKSTLKELLAVDDPEMQIKVYNEIVRRDLSRKDIRTLIAKLRKGKASRAEKSVIKISRNRASAFYKTYEKDAREISKSGTVEEKKSFLSDIDARVEFLLNIKKLFKPA